MNKTITRRQQDILEIISEHAPVSISQIQEHLPEDISIPTLNRDVSSLRASGYLIKTGRGRATVYHL